MNKNERFCIHCGAGNPPERGRCFSCGRSLRITLPLEKNPGLPDTLLRERYRLLELVGEGGYSAVYRAEDIQERRIVALKAISLRDLTPQEQIEATDTFNREVHFLSHLQHRNLPRVYEHFSEQECWYLVMDFINGNTLERRLENLKGKPLPHEEALEIGLVLCKVLGYLHSQEPAIIFRDLKPGNIMLTHSGHLYLIDFGIARRHKPGKAHDTIPFGSPGYAAPEQYGRAQTTPAADIYSLGAILHHLCSGYDPTDHPFTFDPLVQPELQTLSPFVLRMVDLDASKRPQSTEEVQQTLEQIDRQIRMERGIHSKGGLARIPTSISYVAPPPPMPAGTNTTGLLTTTTAIYTASGQVQVIQQQNQYYQGPIAANMPRRNYYAIASMLCCSSAIILPILSCSFGSYLFPLFDGTGILTFTLFCLGPALGGVLFGIRGKRQARRILMLQRTLSSAHNSMVFSFVLLVVYLAILFLLFYANSISF